MARTLVIPLLIAAALALAAIAAWRFASRWHPAKDTYPVQGVHVTEADGAVDWAAVRGAGASFGYARATDGANIRDRRFEENWRAMAAADVRRGATLHYSFCQRALDQGNAFNTVVPRDAWALPPVIELDFDGACTARPDRRVLLGELFALIARVESHAGSRVVLKLAPDVDAAYRLSAALQRNVWATRNVFPPDYTARAWRLWQASDFRRVEGVDGPVRWSVVAR